MSNISNTILLEEASEIFDDLHKYEQAKLEVALASNDLDTIYQIVKNHKTSILIEEFGDTF